MNLRDPILPGNPFGLILRCPILFPTNSLALSHSVLHRIMRNARGRSTTLRVVFLSFAQAMNLKIEALCSILERMRPDDIARVFVAKMEMDNQSMPSFLK